MVLKKTGKIQVAGTRCCFRVCIITCSTVSWPVFISEICLKYVLNEKKIAIRPQVKTSSMHAVYI